MYTSFSFNGKPIHQDKSTNPVDIQEIVCEAVCAVIGEAVASAIQPLCKSNDIYFTKLAAIESKMYAFDQAMGRELRCLQSAVGAHPGGTEYTLGDVCERIHKMHRDAKGIKVRVSEIWEASKIRDAHTHNRLDKLEALIMQIPSFKESIEEQEAKIKAEAEAKAIREKEAGLDLPIGGIKLTVRSHNTLKNYSINYVRDLVVKTRAELLRTPNFGHKSLREIEELLATMGLRLGMCIDDVTTKLPAEVIKHWFQLLSPREVEFIKQRYFSRDIATYASIGRSKGITGQRIREITKLALRKLRMYYEARIQKKELTLKDALSYLDNSQALHKEIFGWPKS